VQKDVTMVKLDLLIPPFGTKKITGSIPTIQPAKAARRMAEFLAGGFARCGQDELTIWPAFADAISDFNKTGN
jgi:hypothetical protein